MEERGQTIYNEDKDITVHIKFEKGINGGVTGLNYWSGDESNERIYVSDDMVMEMLNQIGDILEDDTLEERCVTVCEIHRRFSNCQMNFKKETFIKPC